jgi:hypothetical protein
MDISQVKAVYRTAIDPRAHDCESQDWWDAVAEEVQAVVSATDTAIAARVIDWWHSDWEAVGDTPTRAASRIRRAVALIK